MKYKLKLLPLVYQDLKNAKKWYFEINPDLGEYFKSKVNDEFEYIEQYPKHYKIKIDGLRQALVSKFPYTIYYLIEEELKIVVVIGVLAQKQSVERIIKRFKK